MDDEKLGAYLDGELNEEQRRAARTRLEADPGAAIRLDLIARADKILRVGLPAERSARDAELAQRLRSGAPIKREPAWSSWRRLGSLAAACALGAVMGANFIGGSALPGVHRISSNLEAAIESLPSGETRTIPGGAITLAQTIQTDSGYCRQFRISDGAGQTDALACRNERGWSIALLTPAQNEASGFSAANAQEDALDATLEERGSPALVESREELELIRRGWTSRAGGVQQ